jgi:hypothetical protein
LILAGMALPPTEVGAASVIYFVVNYPALQNGYTVTGSITTNGATGTALGPADIKSWDITISKPGVTPVTLKPTNSNDITSIFAATTQSITVPGIADTFGFSQPSSSSNIVWTFSTPSSMIYKSNINGAEAWSSSSLPPTAPIATVPEPSSAVLASTGAVAAFLAYGWSRHRRARRQAAA